MAFTHAATEFALLTLFKVSVGSFKGEQTVEVYFKFA
jgi:hypothetical protein